ncbi:hypothetical protein FB451DRAFT_311436 [Mycena latifolia]|nr:hypothetical protein FB451DRAFT_311436 [Mycena latifolia]
MQPCGTGDRGARGRPTDLQLRNAGSESPARVPPALLELGGWGRVQFVGTIRCTAPLLNCTPSRRRHKSSAQKEGADDGPSSSLLFPFHGCRAPNSSMTRAQRVGTSIQHRERHAHSGSRCICTCRVQVDCRSNFHDFGRFRTRLFDPHPSALGSANMFSEPFRPHNGSDISVREPMFWPGRAEARLPRRIFSLGSAVDVRNPGNFTDSGKSVRQMDRTSDTKCCFRRSL